MTEPTEPTEPTEANESSEPNDGAPGAPGGSTIPAARHPKIDTMLGGLAEAADRAAQLEALGVGGVFTFEGPHDVFTPLVLAAPATTTVDLMTNVVIAFPPQPHPASPTRPTTSRS